MSPTENLALLHRVIGLLWEADDDETLLLRPVADGSVRLFMLINDVFTWACADCEEITTANLPVFVQAAVDVLALTGRDTMPINFNLSNDIGVIFACRLHQRRPFLYNGKYPVDPRLYPLIEAIPATPPEAGRQTGA